MSDAKTLQIYSDMASEYDDLTKAGTASDPMFTRFLAEMPSGGHLLDLGCGPGHFAAQMALAGFSVTATDVVPEMVALAAKHDGVNAEVATFEDIAGTDLYDGIWANFSLLHAPRTDMPRHLEALHIALKPGGLLHIALKSGTGAKRDKIDRLYTYYTLDALSGVLTQAGFSVMHHTSGSDVGLDGVVADWIAVHARG